MEFKDCKLIVLGDSNVGKTTLIHNFVNDEFRADFKSTLGTDISSMSFYLDQDKCINLTIWDTAGTERFNCVMKQIFRGTQACILVADLTSSESLNGLQIWYDLLEDNVEDSQDLPIVIMLNKVDLVDQRVIDEKEIMAVANKLNCKYFEVSAKTSEGVHEGLLEIMKKFVQCCKVAQVPLYKATPEVSHTKCC